MSEGLKMIGSQAKIEESEIEYALLITMQELEDHEVWAISNSRLLSGFADHAIRIFSAAVKGLPPTSRARKIVRQNTVRVIAYLPAGLRISMLFSMARLSPAIIQDMMKGEIDSEFEPHRYNIIVTLGIFARNGLFLGVTEPGRIGRVQSSLRRAREIHAKNRSEDAT